MQAPRLSTPHRLPAAGGRAVRQLGGKRIAGQRGNVLAKKLLHRTRRARGGCDARTRTRTRTQRSGARTRNRLRHEHFAIVSIRIQAVFFLAIAIAGNVLARDQR
jgi:hypothetical protein